MACEYKKQVDQFTLKGLNEYLIKLDYFDPAVAEANVIKRAWPWMWWELPSYPGEPSFDRSHEDWYFYWRGFIEVVAKEITEAAFKGVKTCSVHVAGSLHLSSVLYGVLYPRYSAPRPISTIRISTAGRVLNG